MAEEYWITRDGRKIAVGDMDIEHLRNTLRMLLRKRRQLVERITDEVSTSGGQNESSAQAYRDLANPGAFFPLLEGGVYGSPELQRKYGRKI